MELNIVTIPFVNLTSYMEEVVIGGIPYRITFNWNNRGSYWAMTIMDTGDNVLIAGIKLVMNYGLVDRYPGRNLPVGKILAVDTSKQGKITFDNVGIEIPLLYMEEI